MERTVVCTFLYPTFLDPSAVVVSSMTYVSTAWRGFVTASDIQRVDALPTPPHQLGVWGIAVSSPRWGPGQSPGGELTIYNVLKAYKVARIVSILQILNLFFFDPSKGGMTQVAQW